MKYQKTYLKCGKLFDGIKEELLEDVGILVEGKEIKAVSKTLAVPDDAEVIDLSHLTVTPGLIDSHVHFEYVDPRTFSNFAVTDTDEMKTLNTVYNCMQSLQKGYTTVRTTGTAFQGFGSIDAKRAIERGFFPASRLIAAPHALGVSGGHWDFSMFHTNSNPYVSEFLVQPFAIAAGADAFKDLVRKQVKYGADFIKIMSAGGFSSPGDDPGEMQLDREETKAIIDTARNLNKPVAAHAYTSNVIDLLIELGITEIEHGTLMEPHTAELMEKHNILYVPTIFSLMPLDEDADPELVPPRNKHYTAKLLKYGKQLEESRRTVIEIIMNSNITVGLGSDIAAVYPNHDCWREFKSWRDIGIPALRTLRAATSDNAKIVGRDDIGVLRPGKLADIAAWGSDILNDPKALSCCGFVMKEGLVYKQ